MATAPFSLRQAASLAGVTRATARAVAGDGLIPDAALDEADVLVLRAAAFVRTCFFPGETAAKNSRRTVPDRERWGPPPDE